jgi:diapolycopene oxygenase
MNKKKKVLVIGAGLGGLSSAIALAGKGFEVTIAEKNTHLGGKLNILKKDGFSFDLGPSIMILPDVFAEVFKRAGEKIDDHLELVRLIPDWRCFYPDGKSLDISGDTVLMDSELRKFGAEGFYNYVEYSKSLWDFSREFYFKKRADGFPDIRKYAGLFYLARSTDYFRTMAEGLEKHVQEPHLKEALLFFLKYVGSSPFNAPAIMNLMPYSQFSKGEWYVKGGMFKISEAFEKLLEKLGVTVLKNTKIVGIRKASGSVESAITDDKRLIEADYFVSNRK